MPANANARSSALDGLRGTAALVVLIHHLMQAFFPGVYWGNDVRLHSQWEIFLGNSPAALLWAGHFAVCVFFVMSGYALGAMSSYSSLAFLPQIARRYVRLTVPIFTASLLSFCVFAQGWFFNLPVSKMTFSSFSLAHADKMPDSIGRLFSDALVNVYLHQVPYVGDVLWTMRFEMIGSLMIILLYLLVKPLLTKGQFTALLAVLLCAFAVKKMNYALFMVGALMFEWPPERSKLKWLASKKVAVPLCLLGLYLGSVPFYLNDYWFAGDKLNIPFGDPELTLSHVLHAVGATVLVGVVLYSDVLKRFFEAPVPQFLGRVSFMLYLTHYVAICSLGCLLFLSLDQAGLSYGANVALTFLATIMASLGGAWLLTKWVDEPGVTLSKKAGNFLNGLWPANRPKEAWVSTVVFGLSKK